MKDYLVYHNPDVMGALAPSRSEFTVVTDKTILDVRGSRVWLITSEGHPRTFFLHSHFIVDDVGSGSDVGFKTRLSGSVGRAFDPMIELPDDEWFSAFKRSQGNFGFGFQPINDLRFVRELQAIADAEELPDCPFRIGNEYHRKDIYEMLNIPETERGGDWDTGYHRHGSDWFIFCTIGVASRTGHDYPNRFEGDELIWYGKTNSKVEHPSIQHLLSGEGKVFIFFRSSDREPFQYAGIGSPIKITPSVPVEIRWAFSDPQEFHPERLPGELPDQRKYPEGSTKRVIVNIYERNPQARRECISYYGATCQVCGFDFELFYGTELGHGYVHVHHILPLSQVNEGYQIDPIRDLRPVCPNCHVMLHRRRETLAVEDLKVLIRTKRSETER